MIIQLFILAVVLLVVPFLAGGTFPKADKGVYGILFQWICGQILLWAGFELICVPLILVAGNFRPVVRLFLLYMAGTVVLAVLCGIWRKRKAPTPLSLSVTNDRNQDTLSIVLWCCAAALLLLQLILTCILAYEEGDDAFYFSISTSTNDSDTMYRKLPYTGASTDISARHSLAPFPIWIAFLARISGMHPVVIAQIVLPVVLSLMSYSIYLLIGRHLLSNSPGKLPLFMVILECLVLFGGYSLYTAENFLLVRLSQGKAVLANIILPFIFLMFYILLEQLQKTKTSGSGYWLLLACVMTAGCLCSTQSIQLTGMLFGIAGMCTIISYRKWKLLLPMAGCVVIPCCMLLLYSWLQ